MSDREPCPMCQGCGTVPKPKPVPKEPLDVYKFPVPMCAECGHRHEGEHEYECRARPTERWSVAISCPGCADCLPVGRPGHYGDAPPKWTHICPCKKRRATRVTFCPECWMDVEVRAAGHDDAALEESLCEAHEEIDDLSG